MGQLSEHRGPREQDGSLFRTTHWSEVARASDADPIVRRAALASLLGTYLPALRAYLRWHRRITDDRLDDLLQGFACDKVVADELFSHADPARGQFRSFVLKSLERYVRRVHRHDAAAKRRPAGVVMSLDSDEVAAEADDILADDGPAAASSFDVEWARRVIERALERMRDDFRRDGRDRLWALFEQRVVKPTFEDTPAIEYDVLVPRLGLESAAQAANLLVTAKRSFARHLRAIIGEYTPAEREIDDELRHLWDAFAGRDGGALAGRRGPPA